MLKFAGLFAAVLAAWHFYDHEWLAGILWVLAMLALTAGDLWWKAARSAWRTDR